VAEQLPEAEVLEEVAGLLADQGHVALSFGGGSLHAARGRDQVPAERPREEDRAGHGEPLAGLEQRARAGEHGAHQGEEVARQAGLAARLSKELDRPVEMINTGVSGLRAWHHLFTLQESEKFSPDIAVVMMGINDWNRHIKLAQRSTVEGVVAYIGRFSVGETVLFRAIRMARAFTNSLVGPAGAVREETLAYRRSQHDSLSRKDVRSFQVSEVSKDYQTSVDGIAAECRKRRMLCFFVDQATAYDSAIEPALKHRLWMTPPDEQYTLSLDDMANIARFYNAWLQREAEKDGMEFCGIAKDVAPTTEYFFDDCHFNERGAQRIASLVAACVEPRIRARFAR
jgi:lysophospholipase L1-like esterase